LRYYRVLASQAGGADDCRRAGSSRARSTGWGGISKCGDAMMREMLFEAALVLMTHSRWTREEAAAT
jgi:transposase